MSSIFKKFNMTTEFIAAMMLAAIFSTFLLQIFSRYFLLDPFGWTLELCLTLWIWLVFFGNAFVVRDKDHVAFNLLLLASPKKIQRIMALISAASIAIIMLWAFLPTIDYIDWMALRKSAILRVPLRTIFSIYGIFMVVIIIRYLYKIFRVCKKEYKVDDE